MSLFVPFSKLHEFVEILKEFAVGDILYHKNRVSLLGKLRNISSVLPLRANCWTIDEKDVQVISSFCNSTYEMVTDSSKLAIICTAQKLLKQVIDKYDDAEKEIGKTETFKAHFNHLPSTISTACEWSKYYLDHYIGRYRYNQTIRDMGPDIVDNMLLTQKPTTPILFSKSYTENIYKRTLAARVTTTTKANFEQQRSEQTDLDFDLPEPTQTTLPIRSFCIPTYVNESNWKAHMSSHKEEEIILKTDSATAILTTAKCTEEEEKNLAIDYDDESQKIKINLARLIYQFMKSRRAATVPEIRHNVHHAIKEYCKMFGTLYQVITKKAINQTLAQLKKDNILTHEPITGTYILRESMDNRFLFEAHMESGRAKTERQNNAHLEKMWSNYLTLVRPLDETSQVCQHPMQTRKICTLCGLLTHRGQKHLDDIRKQHTTLSPSLPPVNLNSPAFNANDVFDPKTLVEEMVGLIDKLVTKFEPHMQSTFSKILLGNAPKKAEELMDGLSPKLNEISNNLNELAPEMRATTAKISAAIPKIEQTADAVQQTSVEMKTQMQQFNDTMKSIATSISSFKKDFMSMFSGPHHSSDFRVLELIIATLATFLALTTCNDSLSKTCIILIFTTATGITSTLAATLANFVNNFSNSTFTAHGGPIVGAAETALEGFVQVFHNILKPTTPLEKKIDINRISIVTSYVKAIKTVKDFFVFIIEVMKQSLIQLYEWYYGVPYGADEEMIKLINDGLTWVHIVNALHQEKDLKDSLKNAVRRMQIDHLTVAGNTIEKKLIEKKVDTHFLPVFMEVF